MSKRKLESWKIWQATCSLNPISWDMSFQGMGHSHLETYILWIYPAMQTYHWKCAVLCTTCCKRIRTWFDMHFWIHWHGCFLKCALHRMYLLVPFVVGLFGLGWFSVLWTTCRSLPGSSTFALHLCWVCDDCPSGEVTPWKKTHEKSLTGGESVDTFRCFFRSFGVNTSTWRIQRM